MDQSVAFNEICRRSSHCDQKYGFASIYLYEYFKLEVAWDYTIYEIFGQSGEHKHE